MLGTALGPGDAVVNSGYLYDSKLWRGSRRLTPVLLYTCSFIYPTTLNGFLLCPSLDEKMGMEKVAWPDHMG